MNDFLQYFILVPLIGYLLNVLMPAKNESLIFSTAVVTVGLNTLMLAVFLVEWISMGSPDAHMNGLVLYENSATHFSIDFFFDLYTAVYFAVTSVLAFLVLIFSRYYIHREKGFKRFFNNILFFYLGILFMLFAGNFETMFIGLEIIGMTSFFLIAFYRDRYLPVKNALKVVSLYRIADVILLLAIWTSHHYFEKNISFAELKHMSEMHIPIFNNSAYAMIIPMLFLVVAMVKSAQLPFSSWLPRAMEGPTTSSAIFYGSISVHIGVFILLRTWPMWEYNTLFKVLVLTIGLSTGIVAALIARVQSSVKTQIAYSSIAQIGIMFVEVALGWHALALFHFASNAFLRTYQLLVSPSVLSYLIHDQFFHFIPPQHVVKNNFWGRLQNSVYILSIKEWNLDTMMYRFLWKPLKALGNSFGFISTRSVIFFFLPFYVVGLYLVYHQEVVPSVVKAYLPTALAVIGLMMILRSFVKRNEATNPWLLVVTNQMFTALAIAFNEQFDFAQIHLYLSGIMISGVVGYLIIVRLKKKNEPITLDRFQGLSYEYPRLSIIFLIACLGLAGFPITPTFIGEDVILGHIHQNQFGLTILIALSLILDGLAVFRIYARLFLGPHEKGYHEVAYRSS